MSRHTPEARPRAAAPVTAYTAAPARSGGQTLDKHTQATMSARFGHDFSQVRIHTDARAQESASALGANAFAHGSDIAFGPGQFTPGSPSTERLLAHELTHVVQQAQHGPSDPERPSRRGDASEREANSLSSQVLAGQMVQVQAVPQAAFARDERDASPLMMQGTGIAGEHQTWWDKFQNSLPYQIATHDTVGGGASLAVNKLDSIKKSADQAEVFQKLDMTEFRANHPELTPLGPDASEAARAAQQEGWGMNSAAEATEREAQGSMRPLGQTAEEGEQALQNAERCELPLKGLPALKLVSRIASPFSAYSDGKSLYNDVKNGHYADAVADGAGMASGAIGTVEALSAAGTWTGLTSTTGTLATTAEALGPAGAVLGAGAGGYALGKAALGEANDHAKKTQLFGKGEDGQIRDSTDEAADMGLMMKQFYGGGTIGNIAGAGTAIGASWGTAAYSLADEVTGGGLGAAVSGLFGDDDDDMVPLGPVIMQQMQKIQQITARGNGQAK